MSGPARPDAPGDGVHQEATVSGHGVVNQAGRDQHIHLGDGVRRVLPTRDGPDSPCPYPGLAAFTRDQAKWFFGRERLKADLIRRLDTAVADGGPVMVVAASGAGKSSLLQAGLLHDVASGKLGVEGSRAWPQVVLVPGSHPMHDAAAALAAALPGAAATRPSPTPGADDLDTLLMSLAQGASVPGKPVARVVLVVDQFEELFTLCDSEAERAEFISWLWRAPDPSRVGGPLAVVACGLRADFYAQCITGHQELRRSLQADQVVVGPMSEDELRQAITAPARIAGLEIDPGLADLLLSDLRATRDRRAAPGGERSASYDAGRLPLLAHALRATWQQHHGSLLTVEGYRTTGGIDRAIAETADRVYERLDHAGQREAKLMFLRLVKIGDAPPSDARRSVARSDLAASSAAATVLDRYIDSRLLTSTEDAVQITHEALLSAWPKLKDWLDEDRAGHLTRQQIEDAAAEWDRVNDASLLYRGARLETAASWAAIHPGDLAPLAQNFLHASGRLARRATSIRRGVIACLTALTLIASAAAALAVWQAKAASEQRDQAVFNQTSADALALSESNTPLAADLNVAAYEMNPASSTADSIIGSRLISSENTPLSTSLNAGSGAVYGLALSKNGHLLVTTGAGDPVRLWAVGSAGHARLESSTKPPTAGVDSATLTPDGRLLAVGSSAATVVTLYNVSDPVHPALLDTLPGNVSVSGLAVSSDGRLLAVGRSDGQVQLWNVADPAHLSQVGSPLTASEIGGRSGGFVRALAFSPDGRELVSGGEDGIIRLWSLADPASPQLTAHVSAAGTNAGIAASETGTGATAVDSVSFSPDGQMLASTDVDDTIELWSVASPASPQPLGQPSAPNTDEVFTAAFSPNGQVLASAGYDGAVRLWNIADPRRPQPLGQPLTAGTGTVFSVAFGPDSTTLDSGAQDGTVRLWTLPRTLLTGPADQVDSVAFSPNKQTMATSGADGKVRLWDVADPASPRALGTPLTFSGSTSEVDSVRISPNGRLLAASDYAGVIKFWDISDPAHPVPFGNGLNIDGAVSGILNRLLSGRLGTGPGSDPMYSIAFSPDGQTVAVGDSLGLAWLFSIPDPAHPALAGLGVPKYSGDESVEDLAFSPDGRELAVSYSGDDEVELWNVPSASTAALLTGKPFSSGTLLPTALAFTPDGRRLAVGNGDGSVQMWNVAHPATPRQLATLTSGRGVAVSPVDSVAVNASGQLLAAGHDDGTVSVWSLVTASGSPSAGPMLLTADTNRVYAVAFSPNGTLATGSADETVQLWNLNVRAAIDRVCALAGSDLTSTRWNAYITQFRYHPICPA